MGIFPDRDSAFCLVGSVLADQDNEWTEGRRYLGLDFLSRCRLTTIPGKGPKTAETVMEVHSDSPCRL